MSKIFMSYRREDSNATCGRIYDRLVARFGKETVFKDVDSIPLGVPFPDYIAGVIRQCAVQLVVIGPRFSDVTDTTGRPRLENPEDFVRVEVEAGLARALRRETVVVPVLVQGATMPDRRALPESLRLLVSINGLPVRYDPDFAGDMHRLITQIEGWLGATPAEPVMPVQPGPSPQATIPTADPRLARARRLADEARAAYEAGDFTDAYLKAEDALGVPAAARLAPNDAALAAPRADLLALLAAERAQLTAQSRWDDALAVLDQQLDLVPADADPLAERARLPLRAGRPDEALAVARQLSERPNAAVEDWLLRARTLIAVRRPDEAWQALVEAQRGCRARRSRRRRRAGRMGASTRGATRSRAKHANTRESGIQTTMPVGAYPTGASPYGVGDIAGNVWEWMSSLFKPCPYSVNDGCEAVNYTENRVPRGGAWNSDSSLARAAFRDLVLYLPDGFDGGIGFRVALAAPGA